MRARPGDKTLYVKETSANQKEIQAQKTSERKSPNSEPGDAVKSVHSSQNQENYANHAWSPSQVRVRGMLRGKRPVRIVGRCPFMIYTIYEPESVGYILTQMSKPVYAI